MRGRVRTVGGRPGRGAARLLGPWLALGLAVGACGDDGGGDGGDGGPDAGPLPNLDAGPSGDAGAPDLDGGLPPRADAGLLCDDMVCDPRAPATDPRCGEAERCRLVGPAPTCEREVGPSGVGALCRELDQCAGGLACVRRTTGAVCGALCCPGDDGPCGPGERCATVAVLADGTPAGWGVCTGRRPCDPFAPEATCEPGEGCYVVSGDGRTDCRAAGIAQVGERCDRQRDCVPGAFCGGAGVPGRCVALCALGGEPSCPASLRCAASPPTTPEGVGICME